MSNIIDLFDNGHINVLESSSFVVVASLIELDYPRCFIAKRDNNFFAFMECENDSEHVSWTVSKITLEQIKSVHLGKSNVQSLFNDDLFEIKYNFCNDNGVIVQANPSHKIKGSYFSSNFGDLDELFDIHGLQEASIQRKENSLSIVFEKENEGSTSLILKSINYIKDLMKNLSNPFDILKTNLSVQRASTVITFTAKSDLNNDVNLTPDLKPLSNESFLEVSNIFSSNEPLSLLSHTKSSKKILTKYKGIINTLKKEDSIRPKIVIAMSDFSKPTSFDMGKKSADIHRKVLDEAIEMINNKTEIVENNIEIYGVLIGIYLTQKGSFRFKEIGGQERLINGSIDVALQRRMESCVVRGAIYKAKIKQITSIVDGIEQKKTYVLCDLTFQRKTEQHGNISLFE